MYRRGSESLQNGNFGVVHSAQLFQPVMALILGIEAPLNLNHPGSKYKDTSEQKF